METNCDRVDYLTETVRVPLSGDVRVLSDDLDVTASPREHVRAPRGDIRTNGGLMDGVTGESLVTNLLNALRQGDGGQGVAGEGTGLDRGDTRGQGQGGDLVVFERRLADNGCRCLRQINTGQGVLGESAVTNLRESL